MVIQCPHCQAPFKLPKSKVKPGGTKVRCTKCKIIFMVTPPQQGDVASQSNSSAAGYKDFEADREAGNAPDFAAGFEAADFFSDGDEGDEFLLGQESDEKALFLAVDEAEFEQQEALSWSEDEADPFAFDDAKEQEGPSGAGESPSSLFEESAAEESLPPLFEEPAAEGAGSEEAPAEITLALAVEDQSKDDDALAELAAEDSFLDEAPFRRPLPAPRPPAERRKPVRGKWLLWLVLLVLLAGGGYAYYARQQLSASWQQLLIDWQLIPVPPPEGLALKPVKLTGYFIGNRREGRLFVIQGQVLNEGAEARAAIVVQGTVYDPSGQALVQQSAFCGNPMSKKQLGSWSMLKMTERMQNQFGEMLANLNLEPQKSIPFTLVFKGLPEEVAEFEVTVLESEPVIK